MTSCGEDTCYYDLNVHNDGTAYSNKTGTINVSAKESNEIDTGISTDQFTVSVSGIVFMCTDDKYEVNNYSTVCRDRNKEICITECNIDPKQLETSLRNCWVSCNIANQKIKGICQFEDFICINGKKWTVIDKTYDSNAEKWIPLPLEKITFVEDPNGCAEQIRCTESGDKMYYNPLTGTPIRIGTCPAVPTVKGQYVSNNPPLVHGCIANNIKFICPSNITSLTYGKAEWYKYILKCSNKQQISTELCSSVSNNTATICLNGNLLGFKWDSWPKIKFFENLGSCDDSMGYQKLTCDENGNELVHFEDKNGGNKTPLMSTGRRCSEGVSGLIGDLQKYKVQINAKDNIWTEIGNNILKGDIIKFSLNGPVGSPPNALFRDKNTPYPTDNSIINRWVQNKNQYAEAYKGESNCPVTLPYNSTIALYPRCNALKALPTDMQGYKDGEQSVWNILGKGIVLKSSSGNSCPTDNDCSSDYFGSSSNFGVVTVIANDTKMSQSSSFYIERNFIPDQKYNKICAKICDTRGKDKGYVDNLGGYTLNVEKKSCVAVSGNPSPCCDDDRGVLQYKFGEGGAWTNVSQTSKFVDGVPPSNISQTFGAFSSNAGAKKLFFRIKGAKSGASGIYTLSYSYRELVGDTTGISSIIEWLKDLMKNIFFGDSSSGQSLLKKYFKNIANNEVDGYVQYIRMLLLLYIILYGLAFLVGYVEISQKDLIIRVLKIGVVLTLISPDGYTFLYNNFFKLFIEGTDALIQKSNFIGTGDNTFSFADNALFFLLYNKATWLKILSILIASPLGVIFFIFYLIGILYFLIGIFSAVVSYLMCILAVAILIFISPIFIPFILFEKTSYLFHNWLKLLVRYTLEPVLLIIGLQVLVSIFYAVLINSIDFTVCWKCMIPINFGAFEKIKVFLDGISVTTSVFCLPFFGPWGYYGSGGMLFGGLGILLPNLILLVIVAKLIRDYSEFIIIMLDSFMGQSPSLMAPGGDASAGGAARFVRGKLGIGKLEKWSSKKVRGGIKHITGINFRTKEEVEDDKRKEKEASKRRGLLFLGVDLEATKFGAISSNLSEEDQETLRKGGKEGDKAASKLGSAMFETLASDKSAYENFVGGMRALRTMKKEDVDKLAPDVRELHRVLNSPVVASSLDDLSSKNGDIQIAAMERIGGHMFKNENLRDGLLDKRRAVLLSEKVLKLGRDAS